MSVDDRLAMRERVQAIKHLAQIADSLNQAVVWLCDADAWPSGELAESAARQLAAASWPVSKARQT